MALFYKVRFNRVLQCTKLGFQLRSCSSAERKGLILGAYTDDKTGQPILTSLGEGYDKCIDGKLTAALKLSGNKVKKGKQFLYWGLCDNYSAVSVVGVGKCSQSFNKLENLDELKESIRIAANVGYKSLKEAGVKTVYVDDLSDAEAAAEGAVLSSWVFNQYKTKSKDAPDPPTICLHPDSQQIESWDIGVIKAEAQNLARTFMETPSNKLTPIIFSETAKNCLKGNNVEVTIRNLQWIEEKKMGGLLAVSRGSEEEPRFLEIIYCGKENTDPIALVGKGVTFDSGGISLKPPLNMDHMRADMGGAANVVATIYAVSALKLPINIIGLIPLCENMPSGRATKPGDVITTMSGKTVCVDNTDAEGRLILADALTYSGTFCPKMVLDIATLTGAMMIALGNSATGVFSNNEEYWQQLEKAGAYTGDRVWRFPLWKHYTKLVAEHTGYDINNVGKGRGGGSCTAAAFLREFAPKNTNWMHLDMASVMGPNDNTKYLSVGMKGRPVRTLIQFIDQLSKC